MDGESKPVVTPRPKVTNIFLLGLMSLLIPNSRITTGITQSLPKIDLFIRTLLHGRILTGENLEKRGVAGPFRCPLCAAGGETITHLFLHCPYANLVWNAMLKRWGGLGRLLVSIHDCFYNWESLYQGELN